MEMTKVWVFFQQHRRELMNLVAGVCLFLAGILIGKTMSPYTNMQPIIFQDVPGGSGGSESALSALQDQAPGVAGEGSVAGATDGTFVASVNSNLYHHKSCAAAKRINEENRVWFATPEDAQAAGYAPSSCTKELGL